MGSLFYPVIDFQESQPKALHLVSQGEVPYFLKVSLMAFGYRGWAPKKNFKREETYPFGGTRSSLKQVYGQ
jgi:hypothetical protein